MARTAAPYRRQLPGFLRWRTGVSGRELWRSIAVLCLSRASRPDGNQSGVSPLAARHQRSINISTINGESALANPYLEGLRNWPAQPRS